MSTQVKSKPQSKNAPAASTHSKTKSENGIGQSGSAQSQAITPCLWFDKQGEEAAQFYVSIFNDSSIGTVARYGEAASQAAGMPKGTAMTVTFRLRGQEFMALNGGPTFQFTPAVSFVVYCDTQKEIDHYWDSLCEGGMPSQCGWLQDKYGVSWQIVPAALNKMVTDKTPGKSERVMKALMSMTKLSLPELKRAYEQE